MSFQAMAWAMKIRGIGYRQKWLLVTIANYAGNEDGECYPKVETLARDTEMSEDSVNRGLKELEQSGIISIQRRTVGGLKTSSVYRLNFGYVPDTASCGIDAANSAVPDTANCGINLSELQPIKDHPTARVRASVRAKGQSVALPLSPVVIELPLSDGSAHAVTEADVQLWARIYPAVDIRAQLLRMLEWCGKNPRELKTPRGIGEFIKRWLSDKQDNPRHARYQPSNRPSPPASAIERVRAANAAAGHRRDLLPDDDQLF